MPPPASLSALSRPELEALLLELFGELAALKQIVAEQREEIARLKGLKGRPSIKPSGMHKGTEPPRPSKQEMRRGRGRVTPRVNIEEKTIKAVAPSGSRFKGYQPFLVQHLAISVCATCYRRERWITPLRQHAEPGPAQRAAGSRRSPRSNHQPFRCAAPGGSEEVGGCDRLAAMPPPGDARRYGAAAVPGRPRRSPAPTDWPAPVSSLQ